jgi:hypothetical protein
MRRFLHSRIFLLAAAAVGAVALATPRPAGASAQHAEGAGPATASIRLAIKAPRVMRIQLLDHPATVSVSAEDVARGFVTVTGPRIDLLVNGWQGYTVRSEIVGSAFSGARVAGLPAPINATREPALAHFPSMTGRPRAQPYAVVYELQLSADTAPGVHPWPVALALDGP